jgi:NhaP-type Na+/H+ and K+/H+ antiporter
LIDSSLLYNKVFIPAMRGFLLQGKLLKNATEQLATVYHRDEGPLELPQIIPVDDKTAD